LLPRCASAAAFSSAPSAFGIDSGVPKAQAYNVTMYIMAGLLVVGFIANFLIQAVDDRHHMDIETVDDAVGVA